MIENADDLPEDWPVLHTMFLDDQNHLWVAKFTDRETEFKWFVLSETGEVLATFNWPKAKEIKTANDSYMYTLEEDQDDLPVVVRYRISGLN